MLLRRTYGAIVAPPIKDWSTAQLQQRRLDLYGMNPLTQTREGVPAYIYHGQATASQDEIKAIEVELNWRYDHGDKSAELKEFWPSDATAYCQRRAFRLRLLTRGEVGSEAS